MNQSKNPDYRRTTLIAHSRGRLKKLYMQLKNSIEAQTVCLEAVNLEANLGLECRTVE
jgi:hypothetical protein